MNVFSKNSLAKLSTCHTDLQRLMCEAIKDCPIDFGISHGHRTPEEQFELFKKGRQEFSNGIWMVVDDRKVVTYCDGYEKLSKHNYDPSRANDVFAYVNGKASYDKTHLLIIALHVLQKAIEMDIKVRAGATFRKFFDGPHFELIEY